MTWGLAAIVDWRPQPKNFLPAPRNSNPQPKRQTKKLSHLPNPPARPTCSECSGSTGCWCPAFFTRIGGLHRPQVALPPSAPSIPRSLRQASCFVRAFLAPRPHKPLVSLPHSVNRGFYCPFEQRPSTRVLKPLRSETYFHAEISI
jgi:hypothetical protein